MAGRLALDREEFDKKHGCGAHAWVIGQIIAGVSYEEIGRWIGVSRALVQRWHNTLFPEEARTARPAREKKKMDKLFADELFGHFYESIESHYKIDDMAFVPLAANAAYRSRIVVLPEGLICLAKAYRVSYLGAPNSYAFQLHRPRRRMPKRLRKGIEKFAFYSLGKEGFVFCPLDAVRGETTFYAPPRENRRLARYWNNFEALKAARGYNKKSLVSLT